MRQMKFFSNQAIENSLKFGSMSNVDAANRKATYDAVLGHAQSVRNLATKLGLFSAADNGSAELGVTLEEVSIRSYLDSFAGFLAVESPMTQMRQLFTYRDKVTKGTGRNILPNLGKQEPRGLNQEKQKHTLPLSGGTTTINTSKTIVPGSVRFVITLSGVKHEVIDDRKGNLLGAGGFLQTGSTVDYNTGAIELKLTATPSGSDNAVLEYVEDVRNVTATSSQDRIKAVVRHYEIQAVANTFEYEYDLISNAITGKTTGADLFTDLDMTVREEHQMSINDAIVRAIVEGYEGNTLQIDLSSFDLNAGHFDSVIRNTHAGMTAVASSLGQKTYKAVDFTALVLGKDVADLFQSMTDSEFWVPNNTQFINGLIGFYKGKPVLRSLICDPKKGYAIHKTKDGKLAPVGYGILLPVTNLPVVGNFEGLSQVAGGIYSVEGCTLMTSDLVQAFEIKFPANWMQSV